MTRATTTRHSSGTERDDGVLRRTVLKAGAVTAGALFVSAPAVARIPAPADDSPPVPEVDSHEKFTVDLLAGPARFPDDVAATFRMKYEGGTGTIVSNLPRDASNVIVARVTWGPGGTSGWHTHPGPVVVSVTEGELELVNEGDCIARTYAAGEAFVDPGQGNVHIASNASDSAPAMAYATFLGVPDGAPATVWVPPVDCEPSGGGRPAAARTRHGGRVGIR